MVKLSLLLLLGISPFGTSAFATTPAYFQLNVARDTSGAARYNLQPLSPSASCKGASCKNVELVLPASCTWECRDGILSGQGTAVVKGVFSRPEGESKASFQVEAAFDTWRARLISTPLLKITSADAHCKVDRCFGHFISENLKTGSKISFQQLVFDKADDVNYQLEASRALTSLTSSEGLLLTGKLHASKLSAALVFRPWITETLCNPLTALKANVIPADELDPLFALISSESEAQQPTDGRTLYWAMLQEDQPETLIYRTGINDLWAQVISIDKASCAINVLAEH